MDFIDFLQNLKGSGNDSLIESIIGGYSVCFESEIKIDPSTLSMTQLKKINTYMKRKGYDYRGPEDTLELLKRQKSHTYTGDQADAIISATEEKNISIDTKAARYFGATNDFEEAGYLTPKGTLIDFSGRKHGGTGGHRAYDHRQINMIYEKDDSYLDGREAMIKFMKEGNIRILGKSGFDVIKKPTSSQLRVLKELIKYINALGNEISVDVWNDSGSPILAKVYPAGTNPVKILGEVNNAF